MNHDNNVTNHVQGPSLINVPLLNQRQRNTCRHNYASMKCWRFILLRRQRADGV